MPLNPTNIGDYVCIKKNGEIELYGYLVAIDQENMVICAYKVADESIKLVHYETLMPGKSIDYYLSQGVNPEFFVKASMVKTAFEYQRFSLSEYSADILEKNQHRTSDITASIPSPNDMLYNFEKMQFKGFHFRLDYGLPVGVNIFITSVSNDLITGVWRGMQFCTTGVDMEKVHIGVVFNKDNKPKQIERFPVFKTRWVEMMTAKNIDSRI